MLDSATAIEAATSARRGIPAWLMSAVLHGVLLLAFWRLMLRDDLDVEPAPGEEGEDAEPVPAPEPRKGALRRA